MNSIDVEIRKQETWGPQPAVTGGNPPSRSPHILFREDDTLRETCQPCTEHQQVGLSRNLAANRAGPERKQGVAIAPFGWATAAKEILIWHWGMGKQWLYKQGAPQLSIPQPFCIHMHKTGLHGRQGNGESAPETVTSCCQHQEDRMCVRLPKTWDWLTKQVLLLLTIAFKLRLFYLLSPFKTVMVRAFRLLSKTREKSNMF